MKQIKMIKPHLKKFMQWYCFLLVLSKQTVSADDNMPLDTVLCLDTSGSMGFNNNEGINQLKAAALKFLEGVEETARQANLKVESKYEAFVMP